MAKVLKILPLTHAEKTFNFLFIQEFPLLNFFYILLNFKS